MTTEPNETPEEGRMPLWQHLDDLRGILFRCLAAVVVGFCFTYWQCEKIVLFLEAPLLDLLPPGEANLYYTGLADKFVIYLKVSALAAIGLVSPYLLYQVWTFVRPGLHAKERRFAVPFVFLGTVSFLIGLAFGYYIVLPSGYKFLIEFGSPTDKAIITLTEYFSLTLKLLIAMGVVFELPVVLILLGKFGIVNAAMLKAYRRQAFLVIAVISAVATPSPDALSMCLVMVPLYILYEISIIGVGLIQKPDDSQP